MEKKENSENSYFDKKYILDGEDEALRLELQSKNKHYSVAEEFRQLKILGSQGIILDAGCGTGVLAKYIKMKMSDLEVHGCDISIDRINFASQLAEDINFFRHDLISEPLSFNKYSQIFNRYVAHHLGYERFNRVLLNFYNALKPAGVVTIIDIDSLLLNIGSNNKTLRHYIQVINEKFDGDLQIGRLIPSMLKNVGFHSLSWSVEVMDFKGEDRYFEIDQWNKRISLGFDGLVRILGTRDKVFHFEKILMKELSNEQVPIFYNKFVIQAVK